MKDLSGGLIPAHMVTGNWDIDYWFWVELKRAREEGYRQGLALGKAESLLKMVSAEKQPSPFPRLSK